MSEEKQTNFQNLAQRLNDGNMLAHPGVKAHLRRALDTGDHACFTAFLHRNPAILAKADRNITLAEHQKSLNPFRPYPSRVDVAEYLSGGIPLGYVNEFDDRFEIKNDDLCKITVVVGRTGSGKTVFLKVMAVRASQLEDRNFNLIILDPQKREYRGLIDHYPDLKIITPRQLRINPFVVPPFLNVKDHIVAVTDVLVSEGYLGSLSRNLIKSTLIRLYRMYPIPTLRHLFIEMIRRRQTMGRSYKYYDIFLNIENRLEAMLESGVFSCTHGIPIEVFRNQDLVIELDGHQDLVVNFVIAFIVRMLYLGNIREGKADSTLRHFVGTEEARGLLQAHRDISLYGESAFNQDLTRIRAAGIGTVINTQDTNSISPVARSMAFTKIAFPLLDGADVEFVEKSFGLSPEQRDHIFKLPPYGQAVVRYGGYPKPFILAVENIDFRHHVDREELTRAMGNFWQELEAASNRPSEEGEPLIKAMPAVPAREAALLYHLGGRPFSSLMQLYENPSFTRAHVIAALEWLEEHGFVIRESIQIGAGRPGTYPVLQKKALAYLGIESLPGKGDYEHKLFQHVVSESLAAQGLKPAVEGRTHKKSSKLIDVLAGDVAYEITLHTSNLAENILADLAAGVSEVVIVCRNKAQGDNAASMVADDPRLESVLPQITFRKIDEFSRSGAKEAGNTDD